jgi:hypothetical protein
MMVTIPAIMEPEDSPHVNRSLPLGVILSLTKSNRRIFILTTVKPDG